MRLFLNSSTEHSIEHYRDNIAHVIDLARLVLSLSSLVSRLSALKLFEPSACIYASIYDIRAHKGSSLTHLFVTLSHT